jgi:adenylate cyclase
MLQGVADSADPLSLQERLLLGQRFNLVAREEELARLARWLDEAVAGRGGVYLVRGEAGAGKSSLVTEFADRAYARYPELVTAAGVCDAQTGVGDAFLPFREILETLTGDVDGKLARGRISQGNAGRLRKIAGVATEAVLEVGPDLIEAVVPGVSLLASAGMFLAGRSPLTEKLKRRLEGGRDVPAQVTQDQIFEQYLRVLERLSEKAPMLLVIDDLHWADTASIGLLFRLGRRLANNRVLVLGMYRGSDVALGRGGERHPLEQVLNELKRYHGDVEIDLDPAATGRGREFVDAFLDQEPNRLGEDFRAALLEHTRGHPLFTVELMRSLQESGHLHRDQAGHWVVDPGLDLSTMPSRVEGVIEERLGRLGEDLRRALTIAAVEGEDFTAEVVSKVLPEEVRRLVLSLSETLQKQHRLVQAVGLERLGRTRLSRYRFSHVMMQDYLLRHLDEVEAAYLHEDVARALEELYAEALDSVVVRLAHHYEAAGVADRALRYLTMAGDRARQSFAPVEAIGHYRRALPWADTDEERIPVLLSLIDQYQMAGDLAGRIEALEQLEALVPAGDGRPERAETVLRRARLELDRGHYPDARAAATEAAEQFAALDDPGGQADALATLANVEYHTGNYAGAREAAARAHELAEVVGRTDLLARSMNALGIVADLTGDRVAARSWFERALETNRRSGRLNLVASSLSNLGVLRFRAHELAEAAAAFRESAELARQVGDRSMEATARSNLGMVLRTVGQIADARRMLEEALALHRELDNPYAITRTLGLLGTVLTDLGEYEGARRAQTEALELDREVGDRQDEGFRHDALGQLEVHLGRYDEAQAAWSTALGIAGELGDRDLELSSLRGLGEVELSRGRPEQAIEQLRRARTVAEELSDTGGLASTELLLGHAHLTLGDLDAAGQAYADALTRDDDPVTPMARAGAARVAVLRGDRDAAGRLIGPVLPDLLAHRGVGCLDLIRVHLVAGEVLAALGDARSSTVLAAGRDELLRRAEALPPGLRASYLEAVPVNRQLLAAAERSTPVRD